jgi:hypothetical protein
MSRRALRNSGPLVFFRTVVEKHRLQREVARRRKARHRSA